MQRYGYLLLTGLLFLWGCHDIEQAVKDAKKEKILPPKDSYIVLLDLSDRILFNKQQQVPKDIAVIKSIYGLFKAQLDAKDPTRLYYTVNDKLKLLIAPQKTTPKSLYDLVGFSLRIDLSSEQPDKRVALTNETEKKFNKLLPEIYKEAVIGNNSNDYSGADIWKYFNEDLTDDLDKDGQNTLFIITDGYMDMEKTEQRPAQNNRYASCTQIINALKKYPDWETKFTEGDYGILPIGKKFSNLKVVMLQVNPKDDWNGEYPLLTKIWGKWFTEMGISNYHFIKDDNINEVKELLEKFMDVKIASTALPEPWTEITTKDSSATDSPVTVSTPEKKIKAAPPVAILSPETTAAATTPTIPKKITPATPDVLPPDESDTRALNIKKKDNLPVKKTSAKNDDDILHDAGAASGFNTGIRKDEKKKNQ